LKFIADDFSLRTPKQIATTPSLLNQINAMQTRDLSLPSRKPIHEQPCLMLIVLFRAEALDYIHKQPNAM